MNLDTASILRDFAGIEQAVSGASLSLRNAEAHLATAKVEHDEISAAVDLITAAADTQRDSVRKNVENVVTAALRAVFGENLSLSLDVDIKRGVVSMEPFVVYGSPHRRVPVTEIGGGVADVIAFAFRVAVVCLRRPRLRPVIIADEPFKHVSAEYLSNVAAMLRDLADRTGLQLIIVSHETEIAAEADRLIAVSMRNGQSIVRVNDS